MEATVEQSMTTELIAIDPEADIEDCVERMSEYQVRRIPVVDAAGRCGIVAQADLVRELAPEELARVVREVSQSLETACSGK